ncbi:hypothetical protein IHE44_0004236 [Lamprotornis superbus]|uniref:medium-chain acyl-CoA ligase n=1 Tax=Lamprotornis superbus TaxID=245042 RepID=A0A835NMG2_9PASS|nr:hypothetical protein IHE44_0004236 [Lamprotornis superbus]
MDSEQRENMLDILNVMPFLDKIMRNLIRSLSAIKKHFEKCNLHRLLSLHIGSDRLTNVFLQFCNDNLNPTRKKGRNKLSFEELGFMSQKVFHVLSGLCGLQRGDQVLVILPRIPAWWQLSIAYIQTGVIIIPGTTQLTASGICYQSLASKARCVIIIDAPAPVVVASKCQCLKTKLIVSESSWAGQLNLSHLLKCLLPKPCQFSPKEISSCLNTLVHL